MNRSSARTVAQPFSITRGYLNEGLEPS
jgi:hypothetical protein